MSSITIGFTGILIFLFFIVIGMPVSFSLILAGFIGFGYLVSVDASLGMLPIQFFSNLSSYSLTVIPMFILMGTIAFGTGITSRLYDASYSLIGRMRGGLAMATIIACAGFSAICGSTSATSAAMGQVALPEMKRFGYNQGLATGCVAAGGTLGILIPPSTILVIYAMLTEQSVGKLFVAGVLPGILLTLCYVLTIKLICWRNPNLGPAGPATTKREKFSGLLGIAETLVLFALVIGGMFLGWFTPTQAGSAGAAGVIIIALARRKMNGRVFINSLKEAIITSCMIMIMCVGAFVFSSFIAISKIPISLSEWVINLSVPSGFIIIIIILIHLIAGCFMDSFGLIVLTTPIFFPIIVAMGYDPIWYGAMVVIFIEMGVITPPVGLNLFVIKGIAKDVPIDTIFKGILPFIGALIVFTSLLVIFPQIVTFLPSLMKY